MVPISHGEGNYQADPETIARLEAERPRLLEILYEVNRRHLDEAESLYRRALDESPDDVFALLGLAIVSQ